MDAYNPDQFFQAFSKLSDEAWLDVLIQSVENRTINGMAMPTFPPAEVQQKIHGHANEHSLRQFLQVFPTREAIC